MGGDVIRRKLGAAGQPPARAAGDAGHLWRLALARAMRDATGLLADVTFQRDQRLGLAEVLELAADRAFLAVLDGPGGHVGLMVLAPEVLAILIEVQTMGRVGLTNAAPRRPTRVDAAMVLPVLDAALTALDAGPDAQPGPDPLASGFRTATFLDDPKPLGLLLEDEPFRVLTLQVSAGDGARKGSVLLVLPVSAALASAPATAPAADPAADFSDRLRAVVLTSEARVDAVLTRLTLPLARVMALAVGQDLALGAASLDRIAVEGSDAQAVALARLGQQAGFRAIRLLAVSDARTARHRPQAAPAPEPAATAAEPAFPARLATG